jgi:hypothetical protein
VVLYRDVDASGTYMTYWGPPLLFRSGGYWWDGEVWYRPLQIFDRASEEYLRRPVPAASITTAADLLAAGRGEADNAALLQISDVGIDAALTGRWIDHLSLWASTRDNRDLDQCVVSLTAHELSADQLVNAAGMAEMAGVAASTFRSYLARGEADIPPPQATIGGRAMWSRPVAEEWAESRRHSAESAAETMVDREGDSDLPRGVAELWTRWTENFRSMLWDHPDRRKRWALRWRTEAAVQDIAKTLGWTVAASVDRIVPVDDLAVTIQLAFLHEVEESRRMDGSEQHGVYLTPHVARMLDWLIQHEPRRAYHLVSSMLGEAERSCGASRSTVARGLHVALVLDGQLDEADYRKFLERALPSGTSF